MAKVPIIPGAPRERGIVFGGPTVRAILDGQTVERRLVPSPGLRSPFGGPGDRLWVREKWGSADHYYQDHENDVPGVVAYAADRTSTGLQMTDVVGDLPKPFNTGPLRYAFALRWSADHKRAPWPSNPWVWRIEFKIL